MSGRKRGRSNSRDEGSSPSNDVPEKKEPRLDSKPTAPSIDISAMAALQASVAAQIAAASQALLAKQAGVVTAASAAPLPPAAPVAKKATQYTLRVDSQGREVDEHGNVIAHIAKPVRTVAANQRRDEKKEASATAKPEVKKKVNPYLAHLYEAAEEDSQPEVQDSRIFVSSREAHARKALQFVEAGSYIQREEKRREQAEQAAQDQGRVGGAGTAGHYGSGRRTQPQVMESVSEIGKDDKRVDNAASVSVGQPCDAGVVPLLEWWDIEFLPKDHRDLLGLKKGVAVPDALPGLDTSLLSLQNSKTCKLLQHPPGIDPLKTAAPEVALPMYLTERERKRIRKQRRMGIEQEKRDKQMMGLIPAPEPKFKLSNFMRILGDQAIADPSKVEQKVIEQVRARELKHEMDNLARKLTPAQRREKKIAKVKEAAENARETHVAVFRVSDLHSPKLRFKIDKNAQQWQLTGTVVLCREVHCNLVYVEGGPRAIRKFTHLMVNRAKWGTIPTEAEIAAMRRSKEAAAAAGDAAAADTDAPMRVVKGGDTMDTGSDDSDDDNDDDQDEDDDDQDAEDGDNDGSKHANVCRLIWTGSNAKRTFKDFKFRETVTAVGARHVLQEYLLHSYWDVAVTQQP